MTTPNLPSTKLIETVESLWNIPLQPAGCAQCKQVYLVPAACLGKICPNCGRGTLAAQPTLLRPEPPEKLLPFRIGSANLPAIYANFVKGVWLPCSGFTSDGLLQHTTPVFWPMWLVDSDISGDWQAEVGFDYQVESAKEYYAAGTWQERKVVETRIRWEPRLGQLARHYDNVASPALSSHTELASRLGRYSFDQDSDYKHALVGGASLHVPDLQPDSAWPYVQTHLNQAAAEECRQAAAAQHVRNFAAHASYDHLNWTQQLLPMYVSFYTDDNDQPHMVYVNGQTGSISGARLASQRKGWRTAAISAALAIAIFLFSALLIAAGGLLPLLAVLGGLLSCLALVLGIFAILAAVWPWQWNRKQVGVKVK